ncbi:hypothetical protein FQR65_LT09510 [Abscondita terminalis]|nr:hypothetical protein FQR65_LT09510 [Abscondita terminalis]
MNLRIRQCCAPECSDNVTRRAIRFDIPQRTWNSEAYMITKNVKLLVDFQED